MSMFMIVLWEKTKYSELSYLEYFSSVHLAIRLTPMLVNASLNSYANFYIFFCSWWVSISNGV